MLKQLIDIIRVLNVVDGKLSAMTESQLDEFARNIPENKISCNIFGIGGYSRNEAGTLRRQIRICLLEQMPIDYDLADIDEAEGIMSGKLYEIQDALKTSMFLNIEDETEITAQLLSYDRTSLIVYFDCFVFGNNATGCSTTECLPQFLIDYVDSELTERVDEAVLEATANKVDKVAGKGLSTNDYTTAEKNKLASIDAPDYSIIILREDAIFEMGFLKLPHSEVVEALKIDILKFKLVGGMGDEYPTPIIKFPPALTRTGQEYKGWYISTAEYPSLQLKDWAQIEIDYSISADSVLKYDSLFQVEGDNVMIEHQSGSGSEYHEKVSVQTFESVYPEFSGEVIKSLSFGGLIPAKYQPTFAHEQKFDCWATPYVGAGESENIGGNPDILSVGSHFGNEFERVDITESADEFLPFSIAVGARVDDATTQSGTSYGFGLEFFEPANNVTMNSDYPDVTHPLIVAWGTLGSGGSVIQSTHPTFNFNDCLQIEEGAQIGIGDLNGVTQTATILSIINDTSILVDTVLTWISGTMYIYIPEALIGTIWQPRASNGSYYQSPTCTIIMAKFKKIKDATKANWQVVREAARATASNNGTWDMYRGFGIIDPEAAILYIQENYLTATDIENLALQDNHKLGINPVLGDADILPNTPLPKRIADVKFAPILHGHTAIQITEDSSHRFVTDAEKSEWNGKQNAGSYEVTTNKKTDLSDNSDTFYPTQKAVKTAVDGKQAALGFTPENAANKKTSLADDSDTYYPSQKAVKTAVDAKANLSGGNTFANTQNISNVLQQISGQYFYQCASLTADTLNDVRFSTVSGVTIFERCSVANATKGAGTWVTAVVFDAVNKRIGIGKTPDFPLDVTGIIVSSSTVVGNNVKGYFSLQTDTNAVANVGNVNTGASSATALISKNVEFLRGLPSQDINTPIGKYAYMAASPTADTVGDVRWSASAGVITFQKCTVANAAKGGGTWTTTGAI